LKNILIITKLASTKKEGFESRISVLAQEFVKKKHTVTVVTSNSNHLAYYKKTSRKIQDYVHNGVNFKVLKNLQYKNTISLRRVLSWVDFELKIFFNLKKLITIKPDVIIVSSLSLLTVINGLILKRKYKQAKMIFEVRDIWPLTLIEEGNYSKHHPAVLFLGFIEKIGYRYYDAIVGTMPNLSEHVENVLNKKVTNVYCVPFGVSASVQELSDTTILENELLNKFKKFSNGKFTVGYAGSIGLSNGLDTIIEVVKKLKENRDINFVFLGEGGYKDKYEKELSQYPNALFTGRVDREHVQYFLYHCDVLFIAALPSKVWLYGWSLNKMIDYMISGKPVIAEYDGYKSMINEANSGFFVKSGNIDELKDKIEEVAKIQPIDLEKKGRNGKEWIIKNRTWSKLAADYLSIIDKTIKF
tara:strand:- start:1380 stop:2624 length:1245 start_codon:yes stop_codon:yes gene_type:complete